MTRRLDVRMLTWAVALLLCGTGFAQAALAQTTKDVEKKTAETWESVKDYTHAKQDEAVAYGKKLMNEADGQIKQLQAKASKASGEAKAEYNRQIKALKEKQSDAGKKLTAMGKATSASWDAAKQGFADAYRDLYRAYEKAAAQFKQ